MVRTLGESFITCGEASQLSSGMVIGTSIVGLVCPFAVEKTGGFGFRLTCLLMLLVCFSSMRSAGHAVSINHSSTMVAMAAIATTGSEVVG